MLAKDYLNRALSTPMRVLPAILVTSLLLAGCVQPDESLSPGDLGQDPSRPTWTWTGNGTEAWRIDLPVDLEGTDCEASYFVQGSATDAIITSFFAVTSGGKIIGTQRGDPTTDEGEAIVTPRAAFHTGPTTAQTMGQELEDPWSNGGFETFRSGANTTVFLAFRDAHPAGVDQPRWNENATVDSGATLQIACDDSFVEPRWTTSDAFVFLDERTLDEGTSFHTGTRAGGRLNHIAIQDGITFEAPYDTTVFITYPGDPGSAGDLALEHPEGTETWTLYPVPVPGKPVERIRHEGPEGTYRITYTAVQATIFSGIKGAMLSFPAPLAAEASL